MMHRQLTMFTTMTMLMAAAVQAGFQGPDGQAYTHIVIEKDAPDSVKLAASEMQQFIGRLCGVQLPIRHEDGAKCLVHRGKGQPQPAADRPAQSMAAYRIGQQ